MCHRGCPARVSLEDLASDLGGKNSEGRREDRTHLPVSQTCGDRQPASQLSRHHLPRAGLGAEIQ